MINFFSNVCSCLFVSFLRLLFSAMSNQSSRNFRKQTTIAMSIYKKSINKLSFIKLQIICSDLIISP